jgi:peptide-methionine (R)-S-oxide reductase
MEKSEEEWRRTLTLEQYKVLRERGTEAPFTGKYYQEKADGMYHCAACGNELFSSDAKFDSGTGWPSFTNPLREGSVEYVEDDSHGMRRTEVHCARCGSHLGHVFDDAPSLVKTPDGSLARRFCINSVCLELEKKGDAGSA